MPFDTPGSSATGTTIALTSDQSVSPLSTTKVNFDTIEDDPPGWADLGNDKITPGQGGQFLLSGSLAFGSASGWATGDQVQVIIDVGGAREIELSFRKTGTGTESFFAPPIKFPLSAGEDIILETTIIPNDGSSKTLRGNSTETLLSAVRVGP